MTLRTPAFAARAAIASMLTILLTATACTRSERGLVALADGVTRDRGTGLEWTSRDHEQALNWNAAARYCDELSLAGRDDWRLPELSEVESIYDARIDEVCGERRCHLAPAIRLGGPYVWTATERGAGARIYYDFSYGTTFAPGTHPTLVRRTLCVRGPR